MMIKLLQIPVERMLIEIVMPGALSLVPQFYLQVKVHGPCRSLAVVDRLHGGLGRARDVPAEEDSGLTARHDLGVHFRQAPAV